MREIWINGIQMPRTRTLEVGGEYEANTATMASGKVVKDIIGWRTILTASWEWLPADILTAIVTAARIGNFVTITYPDVTGKTVSKKFAIEIGNQKIFKFIKDTPMWYNVELTATAQEVDNDSDE